MQLQKTEKKLCDNASAKFQSEEAGNVDFVGTEAEVIEGIRNLVSVLPSK